MILGITNSGEHDARDSSDGHPNSAAFDAGGNHSSEACECSERDVQKDIRNVEGGRGRKAREEGAVDEEQRSGDDTGNKKTVFHTLTPAQRLRNTTKALNKHPKLQLMLVDYNSRQGLCLVTAERFFRAT